MIILATNAMFNGVPAMGRHLERVMFDADYQAPVLASDKVSVILQSALIFGGQSTELSEHIHSQFGTEIDREYYLNRAGLALQRQGYIDKAIALFQLNVEVFPKDGNLWDSLAEAYFENGQLEEAKQCFTRSIALGENTRCYWCENSAAKLDQIEQQLK